MNDSNDISKYYYDSSTGIIEGHCFYDIPAEQNKPYFTITFLEWQNKMQSGKLNYVKAYINNEIVEIPDPTKINEIRKTEIKEQIIEDEKYLTSTDYIIIKLQELQVEEDPTFATIKAQYATELQTRKDKRAEVNTLQTELQSL